MIKLFDAFAGYGGAHFALKKAGLKHKAVGYSEILPDAIGLFLVLSTSLSKFLSDISLTMHPADLINTEPEKKRAP